MKEQTIVWFQDSVKLRSPEKKWGEIDMLTERLISLIGHPEFDHRIVKPEDCMMQLKKQLTRPVLDFSVVIDLAGFGQRVQDFLNESSSPVVGKFRLSRVRNVLSPKLDGCGYLLSMTQIEIQKLLSQIDITHPLLIDDVGWSGKTITEAIKILGINNQNASAGFLVCNNGNFGEGRPGAKGLLEDDKITVTSGDFVATPKDDGFHLADFFDHPFISESENDAFDIIIRVQRLREEMMMCDDQRKKTIEKEISGLLLANREVLFPNAKSTQEMRDLQNEGRFISTGGISKNSKFDTNPPNWLMPSFSRRVRSDMLRQNKPRIIHTLHSLRDVLDIWRLL